MTRNAGRVLDGAEPGNASDRQALRKLHQTIDKITQDFDNRWHFNTSVASLMELVNELYQLEGNLSASCVAEVSRSLTLLLAPFAPYTAQELWATLGHSGPPFRESWPAYDAQLAAEDEIEIPIQLNGKVRGHLRVAIGTPSAELESLAIQNDKIRPLLEGKQVVKVIVVSGRLINLVVR